MCETQAKSPVNTGEQPSPETAPFVTETNGESQPPSEVVPPVSPPIEDQPTPEQVVPPTATDGCPVLPSSGDIAPLPAAETGDSINSSDSGNAVASWSKVKVQRKRKRINGDSERNVKKKFVKNASPRDASSPAPPSRIRWWSDLWP